MPSFEERHGLRGTFVGESAFLRGLAGYVGLDSIEEPEGDDPAADLRRRARAESKSGSEPGTTSSSSTSKATDQAGHTKDPAVKRATIEALDGELGSAYATDTRAIVAVTGDHATPTYPDVIHSGDPVPFVLAGPGVRADAVESFGELDCAAGILGHLRGRGRDARAAERCRPTALRRLAPDAVRRRRRLPLAAGAAADPVEHVRAACPFESASRR